MPSIPPPDTAACAAPAPGAGAASAVADEPPWRLWMAPAAVVLGLAVGQFAAIVVEVVGHAAGSSLTHPTPAVSIISDVVFDLAFVGAALYFASLQAALDARATSAFAGSASRRGFARVRRRRRRLLRRHRRSTRSLFNLHGSDKLPSELGVSRSTAALVAAAVFVCVIAPIAEEFFFRGFLFGALRRCGSRVLGREIGTWVAAIITGILFGLAHTGSASSQYLIPLGFLGFVLCLVRWRTRLAVPVHGAALVQQLARARRQPAALDRGGDPRADRRLAGW